MATKTCTVHVLVEYDDEMTDPETLCEVVDRLLETTLSTPGLLEEYGNPGFSASAVTHPQ